MFNQVLQPRPAGSKNCRAEAGGSPQNPPVGPEESNGTWVDFGDIGIHHARLALGQVVFDDHDQPPFKPDRESVPDAHDQGEIRDPAGRVWAAIRRSAAGSSPGRGSAAR